MVCIFNLTIYLRARGGSSIKEDQTHLFGGVGVFEGLQLLYLRLRFSRAE
jgi:hypothetical protein